MKWLWEGACLWPGQCIGLAVAEAATWVSIKQRGAEGTMVLEPFQPSAGVLCVRKDLGLLDGSAELTPLGGVEA